MNPAEAVGCRADPTDSRWPGGRTGLVSRLASFAALGLLLALPPTPGAAASPDRYVEGELLVRFAGGPRGGPAAQARQALGHTVKRDFEAVGWQHVRLAPGLTVAEALERYGRQPGVVTVEPNYRLSVVGMGGCQAPGPNDPRFGEQWALARIGAPEAWTTSTGLSNVVVAVIDSGVNYLHEDLRGNMWHNPGEIPGNGIDDDGDGYVDDVYGIDVVTPDSDPKDGMWSVYFHGSYCAGILGATGNNGRGITGVNWSVQIMALRFLSQSGQGITTDMFVEVCNYILTQKSRGINIRATSSSWGFDTNYPGDAVLSSLQALGDAGILNVFAAGLKLPEGRGTDLDAACATTPYYPQCWHLPTMLNVAASDTNDNLSANFSNWGATTVDLAAPGVSILTTDGLTTNTYTYADQTSAACPLVAGAVALVAAAYPSASWDQIKTALLESVDVVGDLTNKVASHGRLNVGRAMQHPILSANVPPFITVHPRSQTIGQGDAVTFCATATGANLGYQWQHEGTNLVDDARLQGASQNAMVLSSVAPPDEGAYAVVISNGFGMTTSVVATLTVAVCPVILTQPQSQQSLDSSNLSLSVAAAGALPVAYQWRKNGTNLAEGGRIGGTATPTLWLTNVAPRDSGDYQVVVSNACNVVTSEVATLTILGRPWIVAQPRSQTVTQGANVSLRVEVTNAASLPLGVAWRQANLIRGWTFLTDSFVAVTNFPNIQPATAGLWLVTVTNSVTTSRSSNAYVTVVAPPTNQTACAGDTVTLSARAAGTNLTYRWQLNGTNLINGTKYSGVTTTNLTLVNAQPVDEGIYTFWVTNLAGLPTGFSTLPGVRLLTARWVACAGSPGSQCLELCWPAQWQLQWIDHLEEPQVWQDWLGPTFDGACGRCAQIPVPQDGGSLFFRLRSVP